MIELILVALLVSFMIPMTIHLLLIVANEFVDFVERVKRKERK